MDEKKVQEKYDSLLRVFKKTKIELMDERRNVEAWMKAVRTMSREASRLERELDKAQAKLSRVKAGSWFRRKLKHIRASIKEKL